MPLLNSKTFPSTSCPSGSPLPLVPQAFSSSLLVSMVGYFYNYNATFPSESSYLNSLDSFSSRYLGDFNGLLSRGSMPMVPVALVLDNDKGELVKATATKVGKKAVSEAKTLAALKSHSEAERRRRERINAHLASLRGLLPLTGKMDKATLLAEVIKQVKELKKNAAEASEGLLIPMDDDEVQVEPYEKQPGDGTMSFKVSLCCEYRSELLSDIRQAIDGLQLRLVNPEISTLGGRLKILLLLTSCTNTNVAEDAEARHLLTNSIRKALNSVVEKCFLTAAYSPRTTLPNKRRRVAFFDSPGSSS